MLYTIILAGGTGTRLWPYSRTSHPKQFLTLDGEGSMLQQAYERMAPMVSGERTLVSTGVNYVDIARNQLPDIPEQNFLGEPSGKGTATALGLAAVHVVERDPQAVMVVVTADHLIQRAESLRKAILGAATLANSGWLVTLGLRPTRADTGFGYLERGDRLGQFSGMDAFRVARFIEKPDSRRAQDLVAGGNHEWNSGMFVWRADRLLEEISQSMPELSRGLDLIRAGIREGRAGSALADVWDALPNETVDYGIMEKADRVAMLTVDLGWSDVGTWQALYELLPHDESDNAVRGPSTILHTTGSLILSNARLVTAIGISDLVIIDTPDALLVCPRDRVQEIKQLVERLHESGHSHYVTDKSGGLGPPQKR